MIFTLGYNAWSHEQIAAKVAELGAWLVDIRYSPRSARPGFDRTELEAGFPTYVWIQDLGNAAFKEGRGIWLLDPDRGIARVRVLLAARPGRGGAGRGGDRLAGRVPGSELEGRRSTNELMVIELGRRLLSLGSKLFYFGCLALHRWQSWPAQAEIRDPRAQSVNSWLVSLNL